MTQNKCYNLQPVINWLKNGCDPKEAAKELRIYQEQIDTAPVQQLEQEPIGYVIEDNDYEGSKIWAEPINGCCLPVYLAPVRTKDLTDEEIEDAVGWTMTEQSILDCRAVIAKFKEKNR